MTEYTYESAGYAEPQGRNVASVTHWLGAAVSLSLIAGVGVWGYQLLTRDVSGVPVVQAMAGPMRIAPEDPGGTLADHQGLAVNTVAGHGTAAPPPDQLVLAPRQAGLSAEDVALGLITPAPQAAPRPVTLEPEPELAEPGTLAQSQTEAEIDPIMALANQLAAGAAPLTELAPEDTSDNVAMPLVRPEERSADVVAEATAKPGPGLARSLRPKLRPGGLRTASVAPTSAAAPVAAVVAAEQGAAELDPATLPVGTRLVQIGAFDSPETARAEWARLEGRFGDYIDGKDRVIQRASSGGRVFYRLRAHGFSDISDARRFCAAFVAAKVDCIPVVTR